MSKERSTTNNFLFCSSADDYVFTEQVLSAEDMLKERLAENEVASEESDDEETYQHPLQS